MLRTTLALAASAATLATMALTAPLPAQAATRNGVCDAGEFCYYYNSNQAGSVSDLPATLGEYGTDRATCYVFKSAGNGQGICQKNNAASVWNRTNSAVTVYYNSNFSGRSQTIPAGAKANLNADLKNNNASHRAGGSVPAPAPAPAPAPNTTMSWALYRASGGGISCGFDGYHSTPGRHEGIDFTRGQGSAVYSLTDGVVTNVVYGSAGGSLSTIAIYQASSNKTVIYLHTNPGSLRVGQQISRGQLIATEGARGTKAGHTHVEVRAGRQTLAAKSVGDSHLDNANPTAYLQSQGYQVR